MKGLYLLSIMFAMLSVLPIVVLVLRTEKSNRDNKTNVRIIRSSCYKNTDELHQRIREIWWDAHFYGDANADAILVVTNSKAARKACKKLRAEFPSLIIKDEKKFMEFLRTESNGQEKVHRA